MLQLGQAASRVCPEASTRLGIETMGPHLHRKKGVPLFNKEMNKIYIRKKNAYCLQVRALYELKFHQLIGFVITRKQQ